MTHFIRQQFLHVGLKGSESDGFALQNRLTDLYYAKLIPAMEKILDQWSPSGSHVVIDKLEIDAGTIPLDRIDDDLAIAVAAALKQSLEKVVARPGSRQKEIDQKVSFIQSEKENLWDVFTYFLLNGSLPWSYKLPAGITLEEVFTRELNSFNSQITVKLPTAKILEVLKSHHAAKRLTMQFSDGFIQNLVAEVTPGLIQPVNELNELLLRSEHKTLPAESVQFLKKLIIQKGIIQITTYNTVSKVRIIEQVLTELKRTPELELLVAEIFDPVLSEIQIQKSAREENKIVNGENPILNKHLEENIRRPEIHQEEETKEGIFIENAGLVILHPFLPHFFEELGIAKEDKLVLPHKGLALLHYLVTGETASPEHEMVLPKILCGADLSEPVPFDILLSRDELDEACQMLDAAITHWDALRNTTRDGLRGNFLVRPGKLSQKDDGDWLLQVESRAFDILLDQLPWGISMIKLPWMKNMLWVEWR